jgi:pimeloyl-ACP methyl ester carboxylesterase
MQIRKRRVFYISGFDPRGVGAYHRLFTEEARQHAARFGVPLEAGPRKRQGPLASTWRARLPTENGTIETTFEFPHWDDIARAHWHAGWRRLYAIAFKAYWYCVATCNILPRVYRLSKWNFLTGIAPALVLFLLPPLALLAGWGGHALGSWALPGAQWAPWTLAAAGFGLVIALGWWLERFFSLGWLLRTYGFVLEWSLGKVPELEKRMDRFAERIAAYVAASDDDEIVIVGHSVGANVAAAVLAKALARHPDLLARRPVALLTLGGSIPLQGLMPWSEAFRAQLAALAARPDLFWVDITAAQDVASFAGHNPLTAAGVTVDGRPPQRPLVVAGGFRERLAPENYERASWDVFRMHFQYLMASERPWPHDYLSLTTGATPFRALFAGEVVEVQGTRSKVQGTASSPSP